MPALALDGMVASDALLSAFDVGDVGTEALLFQTGYLTIRRVERRRGRAFYRLGYPNREVRQSLNESLLNRLAGRAPERTEQACRLADLLEANDWTGLETLLRAIFAGIPYQWHTRNDIAAYEGYYASVFYSLFAMAGLDVAAEDRGSRGRADMAVRTGDGVYLIEFKVAERTAPGAAMTQLRERGLRRQVPPPRSADPPAGGGVQPRDAQPGLVRDAARLTAPFANAAPTRPQSAPAFRNRFGGLPWRDTPICRRGRRGASPINLSCRRRVYAAGSRYPRCVTSIPPQCRSRYSATRRR